MAGFAERARQLLEAATAAAQHGTASSETTVLIGHDGALHLCVDSDWPLDSLAREHGAQSAYRISTRNGRVRVEGREGLRTFVLDSAPPARLRLPRPVQSQTLLV